MVAAIGGTGQLVLLGLSGSHGVAYATGSAGGIRSKRTQPFINTSPWNTPASAAGSIAGLFSAPIFGSAAPSIFSAGVFIDLEFNFTIGDQTTATLGYAVTPRYMYQETAYQAGQSYSSSSSLCTLSGTNAFNRVAGDALANTTPGCNNQYPIPDAFAATTFTTLYGTNQGWSAGEIKGNFISSVLLVDDATLSNNLQFSRCTASGSIGTGYLNDTPTLAKLSGYAAFSPDIKTGDGRFGPHGASSLSALGGSLRLFDLQQGVIAHCLKLDFPRGVLWGNSGAIPPGGGSLAVSPYQGLGEAYPTGANGYSNHTFGYVWPAYNVDGGTPAYLGTNPNLKIGSLLQIPSSVTLSSLGNFNGYTPGPYGPGGGFETQLGAMLAVNAQNYGWYPVDTTGGDVATGNAIAFEISVEPDPTTGAMFNSNGAFSGPDAYCVSTWGHSMYQGNGSTITWPAYVRDIYRILSALCVNLLNGPSDGVHGSGGGTALVPYLTNTFSD